MKKLLNLVDRYFNLLAEAHASSVLMTLDRDPSALSTLPNRRYEQLTGSALELSRTTPVRDECTPEVQVVAAEELGEAENDEFQPPRNAA